MTDPIVNQALNQPSSPVVGGDVRAPLSGDRIVSGAGVPPSRGSGATLLSLYRPIALRALGIGCALLTVAWLGERDSQRTVYGELVETSAKLPPSGDPDAPGREPQRPSIASGDKGTSAPSASDSQAHAPAAAPSPGSSAPGGSQLSPCASGGLAAAPLAITSDGRVILNEATVRELTTLPGVGEKRAEAILELRARLGRFDKPAQLLRVRGIGPKSLAKLTPKFVLDRPPEPPAPESASAVSSASVPAASP